jgi:arylsulfatase A-like enzyme
VKQLEKVGRPFFLFVHTYQTHDPYLPEASYYNKFQTLPYRGRIVGEKKAFENLMRERGLESEPSHPNYKWLSSHDLYWSLVDPKDMKDINHLFKLYQATVHMVDSQVGRFLQEITPTLKKTVVVITSDHGEEFQEHEHFVHEQVFKETTRVPLIINIPGEQKMTRQREATSQVELPCLLLSSLGLPSLKQFGSCSNKLDTHNTKTLFQACPEKKWYGAIKNKGHLVIKAEIAPNLSSEREVFYFDHRADPQEKNNLWPGSKDGQSLFQELMNHIETQKVVSADLKSSSEKITKDSSVTPLPTISAEHLKKLKSLGYL